MKKYHNHTGGAKGSDTLWDEIGQKYGFINHHHYWYKKMNTKSKPEDKISEEEYLEGVEQIRIANKTLKRQHIDKYMHLLARNWCQVKNSEAIFAIGKFKNTRKTQVNGGTGWAVQMAIDNRKDVYLFDLETNYWYFWKDGKFHYCVTPTLTENYAGIGTRDINLSGEKAIENVYKKTIKKNDF